MRRFGLLAILLIAAQCQASPTPQDQEDLSANNDQNKELAPQQQQQPQPQPNRPQYGQSQPGGYYPGGGNYPYNPNYGGGNWNGGYNPSPNVGGFGNYYPNQSPSYPSQPYRPPYGSSYPYGSNSRPNYGTPNAEPSNNNNAWVPGQIDGYGSLGQGASGVSMLPDNSGTQNWNSNNNPGQNNWYTPSWPNYDNSNQQPQVNWIPAPYQQQQPYYYQQPQYPGYSMNTYWAPQQTWQPSQSYPVTWQQPPKVDTKDAESKPEAPEMTPQFGNNFVAGAPAWGRSYTRLNTPGCYNRCSPVCGSNFNQGYGCKPGCRSACGIQPSCGYRPSQMIGNTMVCGRNRFKWGAVNNQLNALNLPQVTNAAAAVVPSGNFNPGESSAAEPEV